MLLLYRVISLLNIIIHNLICLVEKKELISKPNQKHLIFMKKLYTGLGFLTMVLISTSAFSQKKISSDQIQPILNKLETFGKQNPAAMFPLDKLSKEDYALYKAYRLQELDSKKNNYPYGITEQDLKKKVSKTEVQPILNKIDALGVSNLAFPEHLFTQQELKTLRIYELQNMKPEKESTSKLITKAFGVNARNAAKPFGNLSLTAPITFTQTGSVLDIIYADDIAGDGKLYALDNVNRRLVRVSDAGVITTIGALGNIPAAATLSGLSWNSATNTMYAIAGGSGAAELYTVNMGTGVATLVAPLAGVVTPIWLEIDNAGNAFTADISDDKLYSVNLTTGATTLVGALGVNLNFAQDADFNRDTNQLYMAAYVGAGVGGIYTVNTTTGAATLVGDTTPLNAEFAMYSIADTVEPPVILEKAFFKNGYNINPVEFGTMPLAPPHTVTSIAPLAGALYADDLAGDGNLYALNNDNLNLVKVYSNGTTSNVGVLTNLVAGDTVTGLSWNRVSNKMYAVSTSGTSGTLYTVDLATGTLTVVGTMAGVVLPIWLEIDNAGIAYTADISTDKLYSVNLTSGATTEIGPLGIDLNFAQDADFNTSNNVLYISGFLLSQESNLYTVNTTTGAATVLGSTNGSEITMFTIADVLPDAPVVAPLTCGDTFYDTGGASGTYSSSEDIVTHFAPTNTGDAVTITFTQVDIERSTGAGNAAGCWDYLSIYNGASINSPEIAPVKCGEPGKTPPTPVTSLLSVGDSFTSTDPSGQLTVRFRSDSSLNRAGWAATVSCAALAVDNVNATKFSYYPNPTTGILNITASGKIENVEVYNLVGQKVMSFAPKADKSQIDMSSLSKGVYLVKAVVNGKVTTNKVIKQ